MKSLSTHITESLQVNEASTEKQIAQLALEYILGKDVYQMHDDANNYAYKLNAAGKWLTISKREVDDVIAHHQLSLLNLDAKREYKIQAYSESFPHIEPVTFIGTLQDAQKKAVEILSTSLGLVEYAVRKRTPKDYNYWATITAKGDRMDLFKARVSIDPVTLERIKK